MTHKPESEGWREPILRHFTSAIAAVSRLTIVSDPDHLLAEQTILEAIRERGFDLIPFEDALAFRFAYESRYREVWDKGADTPLVVLLRSPHEDVSILPFDLLHKARRYGRLHHFSLAEIFPQLSPGVVRQLDPRDFDALYEGVNAERPKQCGENATKDLILRHVFAVAPELISNPADLVRMLLRRHYQDRQVPPAIDDRLVDQLKSGGRFPEWPLADIVPNRASFFQFLQERWPGFVASQVRSNEIRESGTLYNPAFPGPADLPFDHEDVRVYMDNLFIEGLLQPTDIVSKKQVEGNWFAWGVRGDIGEDREDRYRRLAASLPEMIPTATGGYGEWLRFAARFSEWTALLADATLAGEDAAKADELWDSVDSQFGAWVQKHYSSLHNLAYLPRPAMVHHITRFIAHRMNDEGQPKAALLVVDGLAWNQWVAVRRTLNQEPSAYTISEDGMFAWVPTLTPVSRQAIFAGDPPIYFAPTINTTAKDEQHWRRFWDNRGLRGPAVQYVSPKSGEPEDAFLQRLATAAEYPSCKVLGAVITTVDEMVHGAATGSKGLHAQVSHWAREGHIARVVGALMDHGFTIYITSDHGNVECRGIGKPNVGVLAGERGERVHVFSDEAMRDKFHADYPASIKWDGSGLPESYYPLVATGRGAFMTARKRAVSHGGISIEELIVPFITVSRVE